MKQLIQHLKTGETIIEEVPIPAIMPEHVLIQTTHSLVSTGTEKMLVEFSKANLISKARQNPERVAQVLDKIKTDGLLPTLDAVFRRLDEPLPLGYCNVGKVIGIGTGVTEFKIGDRVVSNGMHAEFVCVPKNLTAHIPDNVTDAAAAFTVVGAIGLQGIRLANPQLGDTVVVIGLGLIGLLTCQLALANGCKVLAFDIDENKINIAKQCKIAAYHIEKDDINSIVNKYTNSAGADSVIISASAKNDDLINISAKIVRIKGKIILVGVIQLNIERSAFYQKEIQFQVSCSYGPGRYDDNYEQKGIDYPIGYARWTAKRNFETVLSCLADEKINTNFLITKQIAFEDAISAYNTISDKQNIATLLAYKANPNTTNKITTSQTSAASSKIIIAIIGAGNFTKLTLLPALSKAAIHIKYLCANDGLNATTLAKKHQIVHAITDVNIIFNDPEVNLVIIATRHDSHATLLQQALMANKNIFVEKPIALNQNELTAITETYKAHNNLLFFAGFNRRHAPLAQKAKSLLPKGAIANINITVNAGKLPDDHWLLDEQIGGGRIIGEACHFFDLMAYFTDSIITSVYATSAQASKYMENVIIHITFANGSHGTINYYANGSNSYPKENISIFCGGKILIIDNFNKLTGFGFQNFKSTGSRQDKGHQMQFIELFQILENGGYAYTPFDSLYNTTKATFAAVESIQSQQKIVL